MSHLWTFFRGDNFSESLLKNLPAISRVQVLLDLFEISRDVNETISQLNTGTENLGPESKTLKYTNLVKMIIAEERQNVRNIQMIIYVFISPLEKLENVPKEVSCHFEVMPYITVIKRPDSYLSFSFLVGTFGSFSLYPPF